MKCVGIVRKIEFEIRPDLGCTTIKTSRNVTLDNECKMVLIMRFLFVIFVHVRKLSDVK